MSDELQQKIAVAGLLVLNNKALVVRRSNKEAFLPGVYEIPGGKVEFGENPNSSLVREFKEEVNLRIKPLMPYRTFDYVTKEGKRHTVEIVYLVTLDGDTVENIKLSDAHDKYEWVSKNDLSSIKLTEEIKADLVEGFRIFERINS
ncbi:MAG: NUDIX domain-containing protein [bacterium]|nr:NUDIX domain-containing protein [bacterium]